MSTVSTYEAFESFTNLENMMRYIIYSKTSGTYIASSYGGDFFSEWPASTFSNKAETFETIDEAKKYARNWTGEEDYPQDVEFLQVQTDARWATMAECVAAGTRPWPYHIERAAKDPDWANDVPRPLSSWHFGGKKVDPSKSNFLMFGPTRSGKSVMLPRLIDSLLRHTP